MSYRKRIKKPRSFKFLANTFRYTKFWVRGGKEYKLPYRYYGWNYDIDPVSGKVLGWGDCGFKSKEIKKRCRQGGKKEIREQLVEME